MMRARLCRRSIGTRASFRTASWKPRRCAPRRGGRSARRPENGARLARRQVRSRRCAGRRSAADPRRARAAAGRFREAVSDFTQVLDGAGGSLATDGDERALYGRAVCLGRLAQDERARADLLAYQQRFPHGRFAARSHACWLPSRRRHDRNIFGARDTKQARRHREIIKSPRFFGCRVSCRRRLAACGSNSVIGHQSGTGAPRARWVNPGTAGVGGGGGGGTTGAAGNLGAGGDLIETGTAGGRGNAGRREVAGVLGSAGVIGKRWRRRASGRKTCRWGRAARRGERGISPRRRVPPQTDSRFRRARRPERRRQPRPRHREPIRRWIRPALAVTGGFAVQPGERAASACS